MKKIFTLIALTFFSVASFAASITLRVDMQSAIDDGTLVPGVNQVSVSGSFNDWPGDKPTGPVKNELLQEGSTSIYSAVITGLTEAETILFKFQIDGSWEDALHEFGDPNRSVDVVDGLVYTCIFKDLQGTPEVSTGISLLNGAVKSFSSYPNPASDNVNFSYSIASSSDVNVKLYNVLGSEVKSFSNFSQAPGTYNQTLNVSGIENGIYFYIMNVNGKAAQSGRVQIVK